MIRLYDEGLDDGDIAERTGISRPAICAWRRRTKRPELGRTARYTRLSAGLKGKRGPLDVHRDKVAAEVAARRG